MDMLGKEIMKELDLYVGDKPEEIINKPFGENPYDVEILEKDVDKKKVNKWFYMSTGR